jgi:hypothetical protein
LIRDTGAILLDMNPDRTMAGKLRHAVKGEGDQLADLHLWRLGPGHLGAIVSVVTVQPREANYYKSRLAGSHPCRTSRSKLPPSRGSTQACMPRRVGILQPLPRKRYVLRGPMLEQRWKGDIEVSPLPTP